MGHSAPTGQRPRRGPVARWLALAGALLLCHAAVWAHGVAGDDAVFVAQGSGVRLAAFVYLGAKHMVTGVDHLLYLVGVVFMLVRLADVGLYVTLFAVGHSLTLLAGVLLHWQVNPHAVDALIGLSVVYKALENLGGLRALFGMQPDPRLAVWVFGLVHGLGLATQLQTLQLASQGLVANLLAFNVGVELGQGLALGVIVLAAALWRASPGFGRSVFAAQFVLMTAGLLLVQYQIGEWLMGKGA